MMTTEEAAGTLENTMSTMTGASRNPELWRPREMGQGRHGLGARGAEGRLAADVETLLYQHGNRRRHITQE